MNSSRVNALAAMLLIAGCSGGSGSQNSLPASAGGDNAATSGARTEASQTQSGASPTIVALKPDATPTVTPIVIASNIYAYFSSYPADEITGVATGLRNGLQTFSAGPGGISIGTVTPFTEPPYATATTWEILPAPFGATNYQSYGPATTNGQQFVLGGQFLVAGWYQPVSGTAKGLGFVYNSTNNDYKSLAPPASFCGKNGCNDTYMHSVYGDDDTYVTCGNSDYLNAPVKPGILGVLTEINRVSGNAVLYSESTNKWTNINIAKALSTTCYGIWRDGSTIAVTGGYKDNTGKGHGYVRDISGANFVQYDYPGAAITHFEGIYGGGTPGDYNLVGTGVSATGASTAFFLEIRHWKALAPVKIPGMTATTSVDDRTVSGIVVNPGVSPALTPLSTQIPGGD